MIFDLTPLGGTKYLYHDGKIYAPFKTWSQSTASIKNNNGQLEWCTNAASTRMDSILYLDRINLTPYKKLVLTVNGCDLAGSNVATNSPYLEIVTAGLGSSNYVNSEDEFGSVPIKAKTYPYTIQLDVSDLIGIYDIRIIGWTSGEHFYQDGYNSVLIGDYYIK